MCVWERERETVVYLNRVSWRVSVFWLLRAGYVRVCVCISVCVTGMSSVTISIKSLAGSFLIVQELCESRGGRPRLTVLTNFLVSVDVKLYWTVLRHWSQLFPNMSTKTSEDIKQHFIIIGSFLIVQELCESRGGRPNEPSGFRGRKELLNRASALVTTCP